MQLIKRTLVQVIFCLAPMIAFTQQITSTMSSSSDRKVNDVELINAGDKVISIQKITKGRRGIGIDVVQYDMSMKELKRVSLADEKTNYDEFFMGIRKLAGKVYVICREDKKASNALAIEVDPESLKLSAPKIIATLENVSKSWMIGEGFEKVENFKFCESPDKHSIGLMLPGRYVYTFISMMDENLDVKWSKPIEITTYNKVHCKAFAIDNDRNAYLGYIADYDKKMEPKERAHCVVYTPDGKETDRGIDIGGYNIYNLYFIPTKNNGVCIAGDYLPTMYDNIYGLFTAEISKKTNFEITHAVIHPFSEAFLNRANQERWGTTAKKNYGILKGFYFEGFELEDGSIDLIIEFHGYTETASVSWPVSGAIVNFHYGKNDSAVTYIPKFRRGLNRIADSYHAHLYKNKMVIFYIDNPDNLRNDPADKTYNSDNHSTSVLVAAIVNEDGTLTRKQVVPKVEEEVPMPELMFRLSDNSLMIPLQMVKALGAVREGLRWATIKIE